VVCTASAVAAPAGNDVRRWREAHEASIVAELAGLAAIPGTANDTAALQRTADTLVTLLKRRGVRAELLSDGPGPPVVYGELPAKGAKRTIVLYAHYDGQPVTPSEWATPPFTPTLRVRDGGTWRTILMPTGRFDSESRLFGRAAADDKAPIVAMLAALDALAASRRTPTVNLKFFFEGEEESGSTHVGATLTRHKQHLTADAWLFCDGPDHTSGQPQLVFGARGVMGVELTAYGAARPLHNGHYGNWAPNPALELARALASLRDDDGRILVDGFYDGLPPLTDTDRAALAALPKVDDQLRGDLQLGATEAHNAPLAERIMQPALNVRGIASGHVGDEAVNAIPSEARASIDFRLVPGQTPTRVRELIEAHLAKQGWFVTADAVTPEVRRAHARVMHVAWEDGYAAYRAPLNVPAARALRATAAEWLGHPIAVTPMMGGGLPLATFADVLGTPLLTVPTVNHDDNQHTHDENIRLQNLWDAIDEFAAIMTRLDAHWPK